ncbi:MAG: hypothetical protein AAFO95_12175 [Cyanobacteria bacterium J06600_6]
MFQQKKDLHFARSIAQLKEDYRDHPCMLRVNALKEQLKQEKLRDKALYQSLESQKSGC